MQQSFHQCNRPKGCKCGHRCCSRTPASVSYHGCIGSARWWINVHGRRRRAGWCRSLAATLWCHHMHCRGVSIDVKVQRGRWCPVWTKPLPTSCVGFLNVEGMPLRRHVVAAVNRSQIVQRPNRTHRELPCASCNYSKTESGRPRTTRTIRWDSGTHRVERGWAYTSRLV